MRRAALVLIGFLALSGVIGYAATSGLLAPGDGGAGEDGAGGGAAIGGQAVPASDEGFALDEARETAGEAGGGGDGAVPELAPLAEIGSSVIRTGRISLRVGEGMFADAFDAASLVAGRYGGFVQSSSMAGTKVRSGELLLRVPADRFDEAVSDLRALGTVERQSVAAEDVSAQFVDLEARLLAWQAQEAVLLELMTEATSIDATIRVQSELQDVRYRIEQIQGQLRLLEDRAELATIQVSLREPGAALPAVEDDTRPSLVEAWDRAVDGFLGVFYAVVVGMGYVIPLTLFAALGWLGYRRLQAPRTATPAS